MKICHGRVKVNLDKTPPPDLSFNWNITYIPTMFLIIINFLVILILILS